MRLLARRFSSSPPPAPPVLDLHAPRHALIAAVADACSRWGFFQVVHHGVDVNAYHKPMADFFRLPHNAKAALRRTAGNARGFFDDEFTKQKVDWKQAIDVGMPGSRTWALPDDDPSNACLDGFNRLPSDALLPGFREATVRYYESLTSLAARVASLMAEGLGMPADHFDRELREAHTSYLRLNYYPPHPGGDGALGISPHRDAGFLTVLWQDPSCHSLQVQQPAETGSSRRYDGSGGEWTTVVPAEGALMINTGDMAQIWSNDRYQAPLHRVLTHPTLERFSAPFFYNPGYRTKVVPLPSLGRPKFLPCNWGYFRAQRFAGDFADFGAEIQTDDFYEGSKSHHPQMQEEFLRTVDFSTPFSVEKYRPLLQMPRK